MHSVVAKVKYPLAHPAGPPAIIPEPFTYAECARWNCADIIPPEEIPETVTPCKSAFRIGRLAGVLEVAVDRTNAGRTNRSATKTGVAESFICEIVLSFLGCLLPYYSWGLL